MGDAECDAEKGWVTQLGLVMPFNSDLCRKTFETLQIESLSSHFHSILFSHVRCHREKWEHNCYTLLSGINLWFTDRCSTHDNNRLLFHSGFTLLHSRLEKAFIYFRYLGFTAVRRETAASSVLCVLISRTWCPGSVSAAGTNITGLSAPQQHPAQTYLHPSEQHLLFTVTSDCVVAGGGDQYSSVLVTLTWPGCPVRA